MSDTLLIYAPVPLHQVEGRLFLEDQATEGLRLWAANFERVVAMMPLTQEPPPHNWVPLDGMGTDLDRVAIEPLPMAYRPDRFIAHLPSVRKRIRALIEQADYLSFSIGGLFGDWGSVSCVEAWRMNRPYAVWTDRVESSVTRNEAKSGSLKKRIRARLTYRPMAILERTLIRRAALGLFHGRETYETYEPYCAQPQIVHDIHIKPQDHISPVLLAAKQASTGSGPLRICYTGRADAMKGPLDWVEVLVKVAAASVDFRAVWLGEGSQMAEMRSRIDAAGLADRIELLGIVGHDRVLEMLRDAHLFLFCHKTPESPRCLIEALASGSPIVGYDSAFPRDLISAHEGGVLCPMGDIAALAEAVIGLAGDRSRLAELMGRAMLDGAPFTDEEVFRHRSEIIKTYLGPHRPVQRRGV